MIAPPKPPTHDELEALIKEARERQVRRRMIGVAGIAIASALGLGLYALISGFSPGSTAGNSPGLAGAPLCRSAQLSAQADFNHVGGRPAIFGGVMIYNTSRSKCSLPHQRPVVLMSSSRGRVPIREHGFEHELTSALGGPEPLMAHGAFAEVYVLWSNWCAKPASALTLKFAEGVQVAARMHTQPSCTHPGYRSSLVIGRTVARS
jgi:hypothetical protein